MLLLKLIFTTMEVDFNHHGKFFLFFNGNEPITLTFYREIRKYTAME